MTFMLLALIGPAQAATENIAILKLEPPSPRQTRVASHQPAAAACWKGTSSPEDANFQTDFQHRSRRPGEPSASPDQVSALRVGSAWLGSCVCEKTELLW